VFGQHFGVKSNFPVNLPWPLGYYGIPVPLLRRKQMSQATIEVLSPADRFDTNPDVKTMKAVVTTGNGDYDKLEFKEVPIPQLGTGEVLIKVLAAGVNNTEINTRLGWYSPSVTGSTEDAAGLTDQESTISDGGWNEATPFPLIQGTDCCGRIVEVGSAEESQLVGARVLVRACMRRQGFDSLDNVWMASDFDGAFAQYVKVPVSEVFVVDSDWSDVELATLPCAYGTAENMVHRAAISAQDTVLIAGASGGVGSAAIQLANRRGAEVIAIAGQSKITQVESLGVSRVLERGVDIVASLGTRSVDVVIDNVGGESFGQMIEVLNQGGRYVSSGAIGGPLVTLDMRSFYLKDLKLIGCTAWDEPVFPNLVSYIENNEIRPLVAKTFPLEDIAEAQQEFLEKKHFGNFVLVPPPISQGD
jgi:NADPH:quinone reductase-like Zn-dependent oxidoreductase